MTAEQERDKLADVILAILADAHPKLDCSHKFVASYLLDMASKALAECGR